ncbi:MAG: HPr family phosphocarrier protein [Ruminiclostridium sp.]|jgi:phosphotransferase system HPr-like phosphotransfer protein|nr:HPr family phosphocarrier protein [Ruminiclostridium sp.]MBQ8931593.1 HPr family phosphocarrier protein [Ruminiclostridium sp.]
MKTATIRINTINDVKNFVTIVTKCSYDVDIVSGRYAIDAKSIMGIFSLDLSKELELRVHSDNCEELIEELDSFIVK